MDSYLNYYFSILNIDQFTNKNYELTQQVQEDFFSNSGIINSLLSLPKIPNNAKKLIAHFLPKKDSLTLNEINYLISIKKDLKITDTEISSKFNSLSLDDCISLIHKNIRLQGSKEALSSRIIRTNIEEFDHLDDIKVKTVIIFLVSNLKLPNVEDKLITILNQRSDITQNLINEISDSSFLSNEMTEMKEFLISHKFMKKAPKIKREIVKKVQISSVDQGTIKASEVEALIKDIVNFQDLGSANNVIELFNKLVIENQNFSGFNNGKRGVKEIQKSLDLILKMIQNFSINEYPLLRQAFFSKLSFDSLIYLIQNTSNYKLKDSVYNILIYWIDNNIINLSNIDSFSDIILDLYNNKTLTSQQFYKLTVKLLNGSKLNKQSATILCSILVGIIKDDTRLTVHKSHRSFKFLTVDNILKDLLPIISKQLELVEPLRNLLKSRLTLNYSTLGINEIGIHLVRINELLIKQIPSLPLYKRLILVSILPSESLLYLRNSGIKELYKDLLTSFNSLLLEKNKSTIPPYIKELAGSVLKSLNTTANLHEKIQEGLNTIEKWPSQDFDSDEACLFREKVSIYQAMLHEIRLGNITLDLSNKDFIGLGYDVLSINQKELKHIEVKSKMSLFSTEFPPSISMNEARVALELHDNPSKGSYFIYLVPLNRVERSQFGSLIQMEINWDRLKYIFESMKDPEFDNPNYQILDSDKKIFLKDFTNNLFTR